jgi:hypothetical protein
MDSEGFIGLGIFIILGAIAVIPFFQIFRRTGRSGWWALLMFIPIVNIVVLWVLAFTRWPALDRAKGSS